MEGQQGAHHIHPLVQRRENRRKSSLAFRHEPDSDRGRFLRFMDESGVLKVFIETFTALYNEPIKPENPIEWMRLYLWSRAKTTPKGLQAEADRLREEVIQVATEIDEVKRRVRDKDPCGYARIHHRQGQGSSEYDGEEEDGEGHDGDFISSMIHQLFIDQSTETSPQPSRTLLAAGDQEEEEDIRESTWSHKLRALRQGFTACDEGEECAVGLLWAQQKPVEPGGADSESVAETTKTGKSGKKGHRKAKSPKSTKSATSKMIGGDGSSSTGGTSGKRSKKKRGKGSKLEAADAAKEAEAKVTPTIGGMSSKSRLLPSLAADFPLNYKPCGGDEQEAQAAAQASDNCIGPDFWTRNLNLGGRFSGKVTKDQGQFYREAIGEGVSPPTTGGSGGSGGSGRGGGVYANEDSLSYENLLAGHAPIKVTAIPMPVDHPTSPSEGPVEEYSWLPSILDSLKPSD